MASLVYTDSQHLCIGQFGVRVFFTIKSSAVALPIQLIIAARVPPQVAKEIVVRVSIVVAALLPWWGFADKGQQSKDVDIARYFLSISAE